MRRGWQFDNIDQNNSYAIVGGFLQDAVAKRGTGPVVYHPSNLGACVVTAFVIWLCLRARERVFVCVTVWDCVGLLVCVRARARVCRLSLSSTIS